MRAQLDIFGGSKRADTWLDIVILKYRKYCPTPPFDKKEAHKIIAAEIISEMPIIARMINGILTSGDKTTARRLVEATFRHSDMYAPDTIARALRKGAEILADRGELVWQEDVQDQRETLDSILVQIEEPYHDSSLENIFYNALLERFNGIVNWKHHAKVNGFTIDFISMKGAISIEIDGIEFHGDRVAFTRDRRKSRMMQRHGYTHFQFSGAELSVNGGIHRALNEIEDTLSRKLTRTPAPAYDA